jgi:CBS domain containing-hemolysin-like protein
MGRSARQDKSMPSTDTTGVFGSNGRTRIRATVGVLIALIALLAPTDAQASLLSPEAEDKLANFIAIFVLFVVPAVLITLFWMVHILPEKIAHKRHHPQFEAIRTLCLLSLVFGGLLWPLAWLWAYSKPVMYKMAYGTDKLDAHADSGHAPGEGDDGTGDIRERLARLEGRGIPASELKTLRADLEALEAKFAGDEAR